jgi:hypothetical protein
MVLQRKIIEPSRLYWNRLLRIGLNKSVQFMEEMHMYTNVYTLYLYILLDSTVHLSDQEPGDDGSLYQATFEVLRTTDPWLQDNY